MNDRERLVELLSENFVEFCHVGLIAGNCKISAVTFDADKMADHLIANGVTVQKHGRWEDYVNIKGVVRCSECNDTYIYREWVDEGKWHYCPNCGAKMDKEEEYDRE